ncbi:MAG TPA: hypothetical protein VGM29_08000 [Polyangiaceae bacterium]|jgi:hypothetical protein
MLIKCDRCGAPLDVHPSQTSVVCQYCGMTSVVPQQSLPAPLPVRPVTAPAGNAGGKIAIIMIVAIALIGSVISVIPLVFRSANSSAGSGAGSSGGGVVNSSLGWSASPPGCFVDANGDGVLDIAGLSGTTAGENTTPTVIDGSSGKVLWIGTPSPKYPQLACLGRDRFLVAEASFQLDFYTARSPWGVTHVMARDKLDAYGAGTGCARIKTDDGTTMGVQLPSGVAADCAISGSMQRYTADPPGILGLTDHSTELAVGVRKYTMTKRSSGTEILTIAVSEGSRQVWSHELPYAACTFDSGIAVAGDKILLWVAQPADRSKGVIVGLDEKTGNQLYEHPVPDISSNNPESFEFNGRYVIAANWGALRAYSPSTGDEAWRVGR